MIVVASGIARQKDLVCFLPDCPVAVTCSRLSNDRSEREWRVVGRALICDLSLMEKYPLATVQRNKPKNNRDLQLYFRSSCNNI